MIDKYDLEYLEKIDKLANTRPISIEGIYDIVVQCAHMSEYGVNPDKIVRFLKGVCHNDYGWEGQDEITNEELEERLELSNELIEFASFWRHVVKDSMKRRLMEEQRKSV